MNFNENILTMLKNIKIEMSLVLLVNTHKSTDIAVFKNFYDIPMNFKCSGITLLIDFLWPLLGREAVNFLRLICNPIPK